MRLLFLLLTTKAPANINAHMAERSVRVGNSGTCWVGKTVGAAVVVNAGTGGGVGAGVGAGRISALTAWVEASTANVVDVPLLEIVAL